MSSPATAVQRGRPLVTAVIVAHDGARWLPRLLATLENQTRLPDQLVAVDTGSRDETPALLARALGDEAVVTTDRDLGFGAAVAAGLASLDGADEAGAGEPWLWVLHDDMQLDPHTLEHLLAATARDPGLSLVGPKVRQWPQRRRLLEAGLTVTGTARRLTGVDPGEYDQGQHDQVRDTLAVGSAGMLVRRRAWDALGGLDPALPLFGDDLDLGWRAARAGLRAAVAPDAVVFHAEAAARGQRGVDAAPGHPRRLAREHALYTVLANCRGPALPFVAVRLLVGSLLRALGLLLLKAPREAWDEAVAVASVLGRPGRLWSGRRRRRRGPRRPEARVRRLLAPWWAPYGHGLEVAGQVTAEAVAAVGERNRRRGGDVETGPVPAEAESLAVEPGTLSRLLRSPMGVAATVLVLLSLLSGPDLFGPGLLQGGALLPAPPSAGHWWQTYAESWHPVALGSDVPGPPYLVVLASAGTLLLGKAWLVVDLLFGMAAPLTALAGYVLARRVVASRAVAVWAAVTYGLLPVLTGAVAQGRLGAVAAAMVLPLLARCALGVVAGGSGRRARQAAVGAGLLLAVLAAFVPVALPVAAALALLGWLVLRPAGSAGRGLLLRLTGTLATGAVLLLPWLLQLDAGVAGWSLGAAGFDGGVAAVPVASGWEIALGRPGGPGQAPAWLTAGLAPAAVAALLCRDRRRTVLGAWAVGLAGTALAVLQQRTGTWPGFAVLMVQGAAVVAAAGLADGALQRLGRARSGWRRPGLRLAALASMAALAAPVLGACWWLAADSGPGLRRQPALPLPAFMADAQQGPLAPRTLLVSGAGPGLSVHLSRGPGVYVGQDAVAPEPPARLADLAARLVTDPAPSDVAALATYGVGFVLLTEAADAADAAVTALDGAPGLVRSSAGGLPGTAWRLDAVAGPVRLHGAPPVVLPGPAGSAQPDVPAGAGRTLTLGERSDGDWRATLDGERLRAHTADGWAQAFVLPPGGGSLVVEHADGRGWWLAGQASLLLVALVLVAPGRRRADEAL